MRISTSTLPLTDFQLLIQAAAKRRADAVQFEADDRPVDARRAHLYNAFDASR